MKLPKAKQKELYKSVCKILWKEWDPICVNGFSTCDDEYDTYAPKVVRYLLADADEIKIADFLGKLETESMCLKENRENNIRVATILKKLVEAN